MFLIKSILSLEMIQIILTERSDVEVGPDCIRPNELRQWQYFSDSSEVSDAYWHLKIFSLKPRGLLKAPINIRHLDRSKISTLLEQFY